MTQAQKARIEATPFKWLMRLPKKLKICGILLDELVKRWNERRGGFLIVGRPIRFTPLDVCFALGLRILGEKVDLIEDPESCTKKLFDGMVISNDNICAKLDNLQRDEDVDDFCRLYILLGLEEFTSPIHPPMYKLGGQKLREGKNSAQLHIRGCVVVLQVWVLVHAIEDLSSTKEELEDAAMREALYWVPTGYFKWSQDFVARTAIMNNTRLLIAEKQDIEANISQLEVQLRENCQLRSPLDFSMKDVDFVIERECCYTVTMGENICKEEAKKTEEV
ncbi:Ulp1 peptidase [Trifolium repens]|nr:Ulp1 peptidase [Trifolium repens]